MRGSLYWLGKGKGEGGGKEDVGDEGHGWREEGAADRLDRKGEKDAGMQDHEAGRAMRRAMSRAMSQVDHGGQARWGKRLVLASPRESGRRARTDQPLSGGLRTAAVATVSPLQIAAHVCVSRCRSECTPASAPLPQVRRRSPLQGTAVVVACILISLNASFDGGTLEAEWDVVWLDLTPRLTTSR